MILIGMCFQYTLTLLECVDHETAYVCGRICVRLCVVYMMSFVHCALLFRIDFEYIVGASDTCSVCTVRRSMKSQMWIKVLNDYIQKIVALSCH